VCVYVYKYCCTWISWGHYIVSLAFLYRLVLLKFESLVGERFFNFSHLSRPVLGSVQLATARPGGKATGA